MIYRLKRYKETLFRIWRHKNTRRAALSFAARWWLPWMAARILVTMARPLPVGASVRPSSRRILVMNSGKDEFLRDLVEIFDMTKYSILRDGHITYWKPWLRKFLDQSLQHNRYLSDDPNVEMTKKRWQNFLSSTWRHYRAIRPTEAVISANFAYCVQREMASALELRGTPSLSCRRKI